MIQLPFILGAAIGAGATLYMKRKNKKQGLIGAVSDGVKAGADSIKDAAVTTVDTVKSTVETVKEKNAAKKATRTKATVKKVADDAK